MTSTQPIVNHNPRLQRYYASLESRIGYRLLLGGTRHFGYYEDPSTRWPFPVAKALRSMEAKLLKGLNEGGRLKPGAKILDAGCGVGHVALYIAGEGGFQVHGIDVVQRHLDSAQQYIHLARMEDKVSVRRMDYHHLELLADESFDAIYTMETLVHSSDPESVSREFLRVLKPGGVLVNMEYEYLPLPKEALESWEAKGMAKINEVTAMPAHAKFEFGTIVKTMQSAGFEDVHFNDISDNVEPMLWLFYVLAFLPYYLFVRPFSLEERFINTTTGIVGWHWRKYGKYVQVISRKPGENEKKAEQSARRRR